MDQFEHLTTIIALTVGVGWASGINLYALIAMLGLMSNFGSLQLPAELQIVSDPFVLVVAIIMYCVEFFTDKVPGIDTGWDSIHTFIRIPAGAILAATAVGDVGPAAELAAAMAGGTLAAGSHMVKAGSRVMINSSPEPFSNWIASITEDIVVIAGIWAALYNPELFLIAILIFILLSIWLIPKLWRGIRRIFGWIFGSRSTEDEREMTAEKYRPQRVVKPNPLREHH